MSDRGTNPPWPAGTATGVGSLPGTDPVEAAKLVFGELDQMPFLPELPARGPGADMIGRAAALLVDMPVDLQPSGWRLVPRPGLDLRRSQEMLLRDVDALTAAAASYTGTLKLSVAGPWTLAAGVELTRGHKALSDPGASRDLAGSLAVGLAGHLAELSDRVPGARFVVQFDEPSLPAVLDGRVRTPSGFSVVPAVEDGVVVDRLAALFDSLRAAGAVSVGVHCCASGVPLAVLQRAGADFVGLDMSRLSRADDDAVGEAVEAGVALMVGVLPGIDAELSDVRRTVAPVKQLWHRLGFPVETLGSVVVTPACGFAGASDGYVRVALRRCTEVARDLAESPE